MRTKTPQEKKALSLEKDRRNSYGGNDKASRKSIPKHKAGVNRVYRRKVGSILMKAELATDLDAVAQVEADVKSVGRIDWKKWPDAPLGEMISRNLESREAHAGRGKSERKKVREFLEELEIDVEQLEPDRWRASVASYPGITAFGNTRESSIEKLKHLAYVAKRNELGSDIRVQIDGEFITPTLSK
jgi:hypothetical protein